MDIYELKARVKEIEIRLNQLKEIDEDIGLNMEEKREVNSLLSRRDEFLLDIENQPKRKIVEPDTVRGGRRRESACAPFESFGEQLAAVRNAGLPGGQVDQRLFEVRAATGGSISIPSDGGFLVQENFGNELLKEVFNVGQIAKLCRRIPITVGNSIKIPGLDETSRVAGAGGRQGGIQAYWADEATEFTASKPKFRLVEMNLSKLVGLVYLTDELLEDAPAMQEYVQQAFVDEFAFQVDDAIIEGTGAGQNLGLKNAGCVVSVAKEAGQTDNTIVYENIIKMWSRLLPSAKADAVWLCNADCVPSLARMSLSIGSGGAAVYLPANGASGTPFGTLMGKPLIEIEQAESVGNTGDIWLANFKRGYLLADKGLKSAMSLDVRFQFDEAVFRFVLRLTGQPMLSSPITPFKGSATQSHFIKLDDRLAG